jgi:uncharacterized protein YebE (UPF0316 family)
MADFFGSDLYSYLILPFLIFCARICDVTIGTLRIIFVSKGHKRIAPILGFFEVFIWVIAISQIMSNLNNFACYFGYAAGFATGNYIGMLVEERIAVGKIFIRIITSANGLSLVKSLNSNGFGATTVKAEGSRGEVNIIYSVINRKRLEEIQKILLDFDPKLFYTIEDVREANAGIFSESFSYKIPLFSRWRKGK